VRLAPRLVALGCALLLLVPWSAIPLFAQGTVLFSAYMTTATGPSYGHDVIITDQEGVRWEGTQRTGCGAGSSLNVDCWEMDETPGSGPDFGDPQGQHGWGFTEHLTTRDYGDPALYWFTTIEYPSANTGECGTIASGFGICKVKWLTNPAAGTNCRSILETGIQGDAAAGSQIQFDMIIQPIGGSVGPDTGYTYTEGIVYDVAMKIQGNSATTVTDGSVLVWITPHGTPWSEGSPTLSQTGIALELGSGSCDSGEFNYGSYNNSEGLPVDSIHRVNLYRQQITTAFDTSWATTWNGVGASDPGVQKYRAPNRLRMRMASGAPLGLGWDRDAGRTH
jgi:hypothetical protein